jgi:hypothetical protein
MSEHEMKSSFQLYWIIIPQIRILTNTILGVIGDLGKAQMPSKFTSS